VIGLAGGESKAIKPANPIAIANAIATHFHIDSSETSCSGYVGFALAAPPCKAAKRNVQVVLLGGGIIAILFGSAKDLLVCARRESRERHLKEAASVGGLVTLALGRPVYWPGCFLWVVAVRVHHLKVERRTVQPFLPWVDIHYLSGAAEAALSFARLLRR
jgi:hypothetical protein